MTTGRINQVTIVAGGQARAGAAGSTPKGQNRYQGGDMDEARCPARSRSGPGPPSGCGLSNCPHWVSQRIVRLRDSAGPARAACCLLHQFLERGFPVARHASMGGYRLRKVPECLVGSDGHGPTTHRLPLSPQERSCRASVTQRRAQPPVPRGPTGLFVAAGC